METLNIGFGNIVNQDKIVSILNADSQPIKRLIQEAREREMLLDGTMGRKTRSVIITVSNHVVLSSLQTETVQQRLEEGK